MTPWFCIRLPFVGDLSASFVSSDVRSFFCFVSFWGRFYLLPGTSRLSIGDFFSSCVLCEGDVFLRGLVFCLGVSLFCWLDLFGRFVC